MNTHIVPTIGIDASSFPSRPAEAHAEDGFVYVIKFSDNTVKVGRSKKPDERLQQHRLDGAKFGLTIARWWVSDLHRTFEATESLLTGFARDSGALQGGLEYFTNLSFAKTVEFASSLNVRTSTPDEISIYEAKSEESRRRWQAALEGPLSDGLHTIKVPADTTSWILSTFFDPRAELPKFEDETLSDEQRAQMIETTENLSETLGLPADDILTWGTFDYLCRILDSLVHSAKLGMRIRIRDEDREEMYEPWFDIEAKA